MKQQFIEHPWIAVAFVVLVALLWIGASIRIKYDRMKRHRAKVDRRNKLREERERRWKARG